VRDRDSAEVEVTALILRREHERVLRERGGTPGPSLRASLTDWEITVPPGAACSCSRAAMFTATPNSPSRVENTVP